MFYTLIKNGFSPIRACVLNLELLCYNVKANLDLLESLYKLLIHGWYIYMVGSYLSLDSQSSCSEGSSCWCY